MHRPVGATVELRSKIPVAFPRITSIVRISREFYSNFMCYDSTQNIVSFSGSSTSSFSCDCIMSSYHYSGFETLAEMRSFHEFVQLDDFMNCVSRMRRINFTVRAVRSQFLSMIDSLPKRRLINVNRRFPSSGYYVDVTSGVMADLLDNAVMALDFGEKSLQHSDYNNIDDGKVSYMHSVKRMLTITMSATGDALAPYGIYNRESIEKCLNIKWVVKEPSVVQLS